MAQESKNTEVSNNTKFKDGVNRNARLIVRNISFKATEASLREHFSSYGTVEEVKLLKKPDGKLVGCGFIHYTHIPMANKALAATNKKPFLGRPISVDWAVPKYKYMQFIVNQQLDMQDKVKKEESDGDDDDDGPPLNLSNEELKQEIKSESEEDSDDDDDNKDDDDDDDEDSSEDSEDDDETNDNHDEEMEDDNQSEISTQPERKRVQLNDAEDGCTVFITNIPFSVDNDQLHEFAEKVGPVKYALICMDKIMEHSKGTGFVKFENKEDADTFMSLSEAKRKLEGQVLQLKPALKRENLQKGNSKQTKDNRNLYLVKEGVIVAGTRAAEGVSASDMAKRLALERSKTQMLKNLNRFVSRYRLVVSNLPAGCADARLRRLCSDAAGRGAQVTEARVMRDMRAQLDARGLYPSKGYGFVMFTRHEDALACLRKLNNNPEIFDKNNRPIVSFSIEDRTALNARKKRLEKSIANNPLSKDTEKKLVPNKQNRKRKTKMQPDESYVKKQRFDRNNSARRNQNSDVGRFVRRPNSDHDGEYSGLTSKQGSQHNIRSNHKLKSQADVHKQHVKMMKKNKRSMRLKKMTRERIKQSKQPKQKKYVSS